MSSVSSTQSSDTSTLGSEPDSRAEFETLTVGEQLSATRTPLESRLAEPTTAQQLADYRDPQLVTDDSSTGIAATAAEPDFPAPANQADWTDNLFSAGNHCYGHLSPELEAPGADIVDALNQVGVHPNQTEPFTPGQEYVGDVNIPGPFGPDHVASTAIYDDQGAQIGVRNETLENHALHPGVVERSVVSQDDGSLHIETVGCGHGALGGPNVWFDEGVWSAVDRRVIDHLNR